MKTLFTFIITLVIFNLSSQTLIPITAALNNSNAENLTVFDGKLFFSAKTGTTTNIYSITGNAAPVKVNSTDYPTPEEFTVVNNKLIFSAGTTDRKAYYINAGSTTITSITGNYSSPTDFVSNGTNFYFQGKSSTPANQGIFQWNGSTSPSTRISDKVGRSWNQNEYRNSRFGHEKHLMVVGNKLFFHQSNGVYYINLMSTSIATLVPGSAEYYYEANDNADNAGSFVGNKVVYSANTTANGFPDGLLVIDAALAAPTAQYIPINASNSAPDRFIKFNNFLFFLAGSGNNYNLHYFNPANNQIVNFPTGNPTLTAYTNTDDPLLILNNKLYYSNKEIVITGGIPSISGTTSCFEIGYSGKEGVIFFNNKFYWDSAESGSFELYSCNPKKKETCLNGPDNPIYKKIVYNNKIYFVDPFGYPTHILRFPEDQGNGLCQPVINNEKFTGNAYHDKNCNGVKDAGDIALSGVTFTIEGTNNAQVSGTNGDFTFSNLASGSLTVAATLPSGYEFKNPLNGKQTITLPNTLGMIQFGFCTKSIDTCRNVGVHLDGTNDYIELKSPYSGNQPITIEMWVQSQSSSTGACSNASSVNLDWILAFDDNNLGIVDCDGDLRVVFRPLCPSGNALCSGLPTKPIDDNKWHHIAITLSPVSGFRVYFDGVRIASFGHSAYDLAGTIRLGRYFGNNGPGNHYKGEIDEFRLWDLVKTDAQILESYKCKLAGNEANLLVYFDFEEGIAGGNNTDRSFIDNVVSTSNAYDGSIKNLTLNDTLSNYICVHHDHLPCDGENTCTPECSTTSVNIGTGVDFNDGTLLPNGSFDGSWRMVSGPDPVSYPKPVFILTRPSAWHDLVGSKYVSPYSNPANSDRHEEPYVLERCFCVCKDNSKIKLEISSLVDNFLDLSLHKNDGTHLSTFLNYNGDVNGDSEQQAFRIPAFENNLDTTLNQGKYCLRAGLRNDGADLMGVSINATLTGAGLIENGCCDTFTYITGYVYNDKSCNGIFESGSDMGLSNATINLYNLSGQIVRTTTSDVFGYYTFIDVPPGDYTIKQDSIPARTRVQGIEGYAITLQQNTVEGNLDFGNCTNCCANSDKLTAAVNKGINSVNIVDTLNQKVTLRLPKLLSCQYVSKIYWGDGNVSTLNQGDPMPIHTYQVDGTYLISIEVTSKNLDRVCQVDEVHFTVLFDCIASSTIDPNQSYLMIFPNPATEKLTINLGQNNNGYLVKIFDVNGASVLSTNFDKSILNHNLDVSQLKSGLYIINLDDSQGSNLLAKFVKF